MEWCPCDTGCPLERDRVQFNEGIYGMIRPIEGTTPKDRFLLWMEKQDQAHWKNEDGTPDLYAVGIRMLFPTSDFPTDRLETLGSLHVGNSEAFAWHVTDAPDKLLPEIQGGGRTDTSRDNPDWSRELGPGLYLSHEPGFWMVRSRLKWGFLYDLEQDAAQRGRVLDAVEQVIHDRVKERLLSGNEGRFALLQIQHMREGVISIDALVGLSDQPYNVKMWRPGFLKPLGVKPGINPTVLRITFKGWVAWFSGVPDREVLRAIVRAGFDAATVSAGFASNAESVIWNLSAITSAERDPEVEELVVGGPQPRAAHSPPPGAPASGPVVDGPRRRRHNPDVEYDRYYRIHEQLTNPVARQVRVAPDTLGLSREAEAIASKMSRWFLGRVRRVLAGEEREPRVGPGSLTTIAGLVIGHVADVYRKVVLRWMLGREFSDDVLFLANLAALTATRARIGRSPFPVQFTNDWNLQAGELIDRGVALRGEVSSLISRVSAEAERRMLEQLDQVLQAAGGHLPTWYPRTDTGNPVRSYLVTNALYQPIRAYQTELWMRLTGTVPARGQELPVVWSGCQAAMLAWWGQPALESLAEFSTAFTRWFVHLLPVNRLRSLAIDAGEYGPPF